MTNIFDDINEIVGKIEPSFLERHWVWFAATIMICATLLAIFLIRKKNVLQISPYELALLRLRAARQEAVSKKYVSYISSAIRDYISAVFQIPAPERTSEEFMLIAKNSEIFSEAEKSALSEILTLSDMVKFAKASFGDSQRESLMELALNFIEADNKKRLEVATKK